MSKEMKEKLEILEAHLIYCPDCEKILIQDFVDKTLIYCNECNVSYWLKKVRKNE